MRQSIVSKWDKRFRADRLEGLQEAKSPVANRVYRSSSARLCGAGCDISVTEQYCTAAFVNEVFETNRYRYRPKRKSGAQKMMGAEWGDLRVLRALHIDGIQRCFHQIDQG